MDGLPKTTLDEKCEESLNEWGVGDQRLAFFFKLCRGLPRTTLQEFVRNVVAEAIKRGKEGNPEQELQGYADLFVLAFQTRDIEEGKGERLLFYWFILELYKFFPETVRSALPLIPSKYGSWKDIKLILELLQEDIKAVKGAFRKNPEQEQLESLEDDLLTLFSTQLEDDDKQIMELTLLPGKISNLVLKFGEESKEVSEAKEKLSQITIGLCGKWAPREGRHFSWLAKRLAIKMLREKPDFRPDGSVKTDSIDDAEEKLKEAKEQNSDSQGSQKNLEAARQSAYKRYRKLCARLNKHTRTAEVMMCDPEGKWSNLCPGSIPARCLKIHRKAFMNKTKKGEQRSQRPDRVMCAEKFQKHLEEAIKNPQGNKKVHGKNLQPHELVAPYFDGKETQDDLTLEAQWIDLRERIKESGSLGKFVTMVDTSGSMSGTPMLVAIAMGILISEICHPAFQNRFLTFSSKPVWHQLTPGVSLREKVQKASNTEWGMNTDFEAALNLILQRCKDAELPHQAISELTLAVFSDMQFDAANGQGGYGYYGSYTNTGSSFQTKQKRIASAFKAAGYFNPDTGEAIVPRILYWNLRGDTLDFPCNANTPNVDMVSGFSASGLKAFMDGDITHGESEKAPTPYDGMRKQLDVERYDTIRLLCESTGEIVSKTSSKKYQAPRRKIEEENDDIVVIETEDIDKEVEELERQLALLRGKKGNK
jgi:uncharacterized protein with von Willebrand factor type A (vWA) domain